MHYVVQPRTTPEDATLCYNIEAQGSSFTVRAFATGLLSAFAHSPTIAMPDFEGQISFNPDAPQESSLRMVVHADGFTVDDDISKEDREEINRKIDEEVLETSSFPDVIYECSNVSASKMGDGQYWLNLNGELTLHGVKRKQAVPARISVNGSTLKAEGEFSIRQSDYEIRPVTALGGTIKLKDELKLSFNISARKQV